MKKPTKTHTKNEILNQKKNMKIKKAKTTSKKHGCKTGNNVTVTTPIHWAYCCLSFNTLCLGDSREPVWVVADVS